MKTARRGILAGAVLFGGLFAIGEEVPAGTPLGNGDANGDGTIDLTDAIYLLNWRFLGGPAPTEIPMVSLAPTEAELAPSRHRNATFSRDFDLEQLDFVSVGSHPFMILEPRYRLVLAGEEDGETLRVEITVLDEFELVGGVLTRVIEEREWVDGELAEVSRNFVALAEQSGDVYFFGEEFEEDDGVVEEEPWRAGVDGAQAGVLLPGHPLTGARYFNEIAPGVAMDRAEIIGIETGVTAGGQTFDRVLVVYETSGLDFEEESIKYYAEGVGLIKDGPLEIVEYGFIDGIEPPAEF